MATSFLSVVNMKIYDGDVCCIPSAGNRGLFDMLNYSLMSTVMGTRVLNGMVFNFSHTCMIDPL